MEVRLRPASGADSGFVYDLNRAALGPYIEQIWGWDEEWQWDHHRRHFDPGPTQVVTIDGHDAGVLIQQDDGDAVYIGRIALLPAYQGRGIGSGLIESVISDATARGRDVTLDVLTVNRLAHALYQRLGFVEVGARA